MKHPGVTIVTIIGMGPRGLSIFERIAAFAREHGVLLQLNLVDPSFCGPGVHAPRQPQHLVLGTPASQITVFPAPGAVDSAPACVTPSLTEWARAQGYRRFDHGAGVEYHRVGQGGAEIGDTDELPRQLLGRYLGWAYGAIVASLPPTVTLQHLRHRALDLVPQHAGGFVVELDSGFAIPSDFVFLTTGNSSRVPSDEQAWLGKFAQDHARYNSRLQYLRGPYPVDALAGIGHDAQVGINGMGLSAHDVLAELTAGRAGRFELAGAGLRYVPSGQEPALTLFSRSGLPALARPAGPDGSRYARSRCRYFTLEALRDLRMQAMRERGSAQLDFERDVLPLLVKDMAFAYRCADAAHSLERSTPDPLWYQPSGEEARAIEQLLFALQARSFADPGDYPAFFREHLEADLREAAAGISGLKAAAAVLRAARPLLQACVEHGGLLPASHRKFMNVVHPAIRRIAYGPSALRNAQLLALMDAGVLRVAATPNPVLRIDEERSQFALHSRVDDSATVQHLDVLVNARLEAFSPETDDTIFMRNLGKRGVIRPFYNGTYHPGGIDIDGDNHPFNRAGQQQRRLWVLGCLTEGAQYDTHALPQPGQPSRQVRDAERCVAELFRCIVAPAATSIRLPMREAAAAQVL